MGVVDFIKAKKEEFRYHQNARRSLRAYYDKYPEAELEDLKAKREELKLQEQISTEKKEIRSAKFNNTFVGKAARKISQMNIANPDKKIVKGNRAFGMKSLETHNVSTVKGWSPSDDVPSWITGGQRKRK